MGKVYSMVIKYLDSKRFSGTSTGAGWNIDGASYDNKSFSTTSQENTLQGISFKDDGTKMYIIGSGSDKIHQYSLSTSFDVSTVSYDTVSLTVSTEDTDMQDLFFKPDGTKIFAIGRTNNKVYQYSLSTAWDLSTASYDSVSFSVLSQAVNSNGVTFKSDGTKMYNTSGNTDTVYQYTLSTAWDLSTASYDSVSFSVLSQDTSPNGVTFKSDGTKMFIIGSSNDKVYQYSLSTVWDLSTASYDSISFSVISQSLSPSGIFFKSDGTKMFITHEGGVIYQYTTSSSDKTTLTNVQDNSIFVEKDTGKRYWFNGSAWDIELPTTGLIAWYDASDATTITKTSDLVSQWNDKSGNGNHLLQSTGTNQPLWVDAEENGLPVIRFDGVDNFIRIVAYASGTLAQPNTYFVVMTQAGGVSHVSLDAGVTSSNRHAIFSNTSNYHSMYAGTTIADTTAISGFEQTTYLFNGASSTIRVNKSETKTGNAGTQGVDGLTLGSNQASTPTEFSATDIAEVIIYDADVSDANRTIIEDYLATKWGL